MKLGRSENLAGAAINRLRLILRFGRVNARAYAAILGAIVAERLWQVPARVPIPATAGSAADIDQRLA
jgi:hypothetical protein